MTVLLPKISKEEFKKHLVIIIDTNIQTFFSSLSFGIFFFTLHWPNFWIFPALYENQCTFKKSYPLIFLPDFIKDSYKNLMFKHITVLKFLMKFNKHLLSHLHILATGNPGMKKIWSLPLRNSQSSEKDP